MSRLLRIGARLGLGLLALAAAAPAAAVGCNVNPQGVSFGSYDPLNPSPLDGVGTINVSCDAAIAFTVSLSTGSSGTYSQRRMTSGTAFLGYNLYVSALRTIVWGDGVTIGTVSTVDNDVNLPVYGRIPGLQNVPAGAYSDTIIVTVTY